jgi:hypothetical protein
MLREGTPFLGAVNRRFHSEPHAGGSSTYFKDAAVSRERLSDASRNAAFASGPFKYQIAQTMNNACIPGTVRLSKALSSTSWIGMRISSIASIAIVAQRDHPCIS